MQADDGSYVIDNYPKAIDISLQIVYYIEYRIRKYRVLMSKDNYNNDLGDQIISDTEPPIVFDAEVEMPDGTSRPAFDEQSDTVITAPPTDDPVITPPPQDFSETITMPPPEDAVVTPPPVFGDDLDAQFESMMNEQAQSDFGAPQFDDPIAAEPLHFDDPIAAGPFDFDESTAEAMSKVEDMDAQLDAILSEQTNEPEANVDSAVQEQIGQYLDDQLEQLLDEQEKEERAQAVAQEQIGQYLDDQLEQLLRNQDLEDIEREHAARAEDAMAQARAMMEQAQQAQLEAEKARAEDAMAQARAIMEQAQQAQLEAERARAEAAERAARAAAQQQQPTAGDKSAEEAKEMLRQAQFMMQQAQMQAAQARSAPPPVQHVVQSNDAATEAAKEMMRQAQLMMQQAQMQAQQAQQAARSQTASADRGSNAEVDRLKSEIDGMRDLINKLTVSLAQAQSAPQQAAPQQPMAGMGVVPPMYYQANDGSGERYRRLEDELDRMRRDMTEKEFRDKEKELERRQREAEKESVKNITPDMIQMSDSRDVMPSPATNASLGGEFIPLASGVFYSMRDKQVYVMTPASQAANSAPAEKSQRPAPAKKPVARPAARKMRRPAARRPLRHGPPRRPTRPTHR